MLSMVDNINIELCNSSTCTGCGACSNICPTNAINLLPDKAEGFYRPVINKELCVKCFKCRNTCPIISPLKNSIDAGVVYAAWHKDGQVRAQSSSGGAFSALAQAVLDQGGVIIGAAYGQQLNLKHVLITESDSLYKLRASKYIQSEIGSVLREAVTFLKNGKSVLFCGTPCQVAGFRSMIGDKYLENLILVDFICHGVPSPWFFSKYIEWLSKKYGNITNYNFRDKKKGWYDSLRVVVSDKKYSLKGVDDCYWVAFNNNNNNLQEACYNCRFLGLRRNSDITISDFWRVDNLADFDKKSEVSKGISMVMVNSKQGEILFDQAKTYLSFQGRSIKDVIPGNKSLLYSSIRPKNRDTFYIDLKTMSFDDFLKKYLRPNRKTQLVKLFREYLPSPIIRFIRALI